MKKLSHVLDFHENPVTPMQNHNVSRVETCDNFQCIIMGKNPSSESHKAESCHKYKVIVTLGMHYVTMLTAHAWLVTLTVSSIVSQNANKINCFDIAKLHNAHRFDSVVTVVLLEHFSF